MAGFKEDTCKGYLQERLCYLRVSPTIFSMIFLEWGNAILVHITPSIIGFKTAFKNAKFIKELPSYPSVRCSGNMAKTV